MNERQHLILKLIVEEFIGSAEPVGSKSLLERYGLEVSSATIRNDMCALERAGYLLQPYTSAGRIPTEQAYLFYLEHHAEPVCADEDQEKLLQSLGNLESEEVTIKALAKTVSGLLGQAVFVAFDPGWSYYTGISELFSKPDFRELAHVRDLSKVIDRFDEVLPLWFEQMENDLDVLIGEMNPLGSDVASVMTRYKTKQGTIGLFGVVGPIRLDYERTIALIDQVKGLIENNI
jgi:transcriptional regulator of heat shock response